VFNSTFIMNITSLSSSVPTIGSSSSIQPGQVSSPSDPDGDGDGRVHKPHGRGGHMHAALTEAFQSLGLTVPQGGASASSGSASAGGDSSTSGASSATGNVRQDMHDFMHELFQAVKSEGSANPTTTDSGSGDPQSSFAAGLSALISQVSNGSAPAGLQDAFSKLAADLQGSASSSATTDASASSASASTQPTLQALLTNLQQDLGYGKSSTSAVGNSVSAQA
jgi:hypothetical protein